jgi:hypothetical protein
LVNVVHYKILAGTPEGKRKLAGTRFRREDKKDLSWDSRRGSYRLNGNEIRAPINMVMKSCVP